MGNAGRKLYGVQFHPEVTHSEYGLTLFRNFLFDICGLVPSWKMDDFIENSIRSIHENLKGRKVLLAHDKN